MGTDGDGPVERQGERNVVNPLTTPGAKAPQEFHETDDGVYASYKVQETDIKGAQKHPAVLVESAAMSAVPMPKSTYVSAIPEDVVKRSLSDAQMLSINYAGQAHEKMLPNGTRKGFFIGDGTGVGKGRQISGIIYDNFLQGRKRAVWISNNKNLIPDAIRDWTNVTGRSKKDIVDFGKIKVGKPITIDEGILFSSYDTLRGHEAGKLSRVDQIVNWLGKDFDGVIVFDEAHNMGNCIPPYVCEGNETQQDEQHAAVDH